MFIFALVCLTPYPVSNYFVCSRIGDIIVVIFAIIGQELKRLMQDRVKLVLIALLMQLSLLI